MRHPNGRGEIVPDTGSRIEHFGLLLISLRCTGAELQAKHVDVAIVGA